MLGDYVGRSPSPVCILASARSRDPGLIVMTENVEVSSSLALQVLGQDTSM
jgi:hypothetical protein